MMRMMGHLRPADRLQSGESLFPKEVGEPSQITAGGARTEVRTDHDLEPTLIHFRRRGRENEQRKVKRLWSVQRRWIIAFQPSQCFFVKIDEQPPFAQGSYGQCMQSLLACCGLSWVPARSSPVKLRRRRSEAKIWVQQF